MVNLLQSRSIATPKTNDRNHKNLSCVWNYRQQQTAHKPTTICDFCHRLSNAEVAMSYAQQRL